MLPAPIALRSGHTDLRTGGIAQVSAAVAAAVGGFALLALVGSLVGADWLTHRSNGTAFTRAEALALLLAALALIAAEQPWRPRAAILALALAPGVIGLGALVARPAGGHPDHVMVAGVALGLIASSTALVPLVAGGGRARRASSLVGLGLATAAFTALVVETSTIAHGHLAVGHATQLGACAGLLTLGIAVACATSSSVLATYVAGVRPQSGAARLLRFAVFGLLLVAWLVVVLRASGLIGTAASAELASDLLSTLLVAFGVLAVAALQLTHVEEERESVVDELRATAIRVRELYDEAPCGYYSLDTRGRFTEVNRTACSWLQMEREQLIGHRNLLDVVSDRDRPLVHEHIGALVRDGGTAAVEFELAPPRAAARPVVVTSTAVAGPDGRVTGLRSTVADFTERLRAERARLVADRRYRRIVETAQEGVWTIDADNRTSFVNARMAAMLGYAADEMVGRSLFEFMDGEGRAIAEANAERGRMGVDERADFKFLCSDGSEIWAIVSTSAFVDDDGSYGGALAMVTDVTERRSAENALRDSEGRLQLIIDQSPSLIYIKDLDLRYVLVNRELERFFALGREQLIGRTDDDLFPSDVAAATAATDRRALAGGDATLQLEERLPRMGLERTFLTSKFPMLAADGTPYALCGTATDITERKSMEDAMRAMNKTLEQRVAERTSELESANQDLASFSYSVAHDLRGPVRTIHGFSTLVRERHAGELGEEAQRYLDLVQQGATEMAAIIDDLLVFARLGRQALEREDVDMEALVASVVTELQGDQSTAAEVTIHPLPHADADPRLLRHAITNLLSNALKFSRGSDPPRITVESAETDGRTTYVVRDNGVGFDPTYAGKLFGVFERLHSPDEFEGTGLGLAIVHRIVGRHGGRVWAVSEVGAGASFLFTLGGGLAGEAG